MDKNQNNTEPRCLAAIDIGSNAARLLIKRVVGAPVLTTEKLLFLRVPLRLGSDVFADGRISEGKERNLRRLMKACRHLMRIYGVEECVACATSAMRDASNGHQVIERIAAETAIPIRIITGEEEARVIYGNHLEQRDDTAEDCLYVDVGGGSTEVNLLRQGTLVISRSYNIGTLRMLSGGVTEEQIGRLRADMETLRQDTPIHIIGSGGNINKLYRLTGKKSKERAMTTGELESLATELAAYTPRERQQRYGLKADRADVIVPAARIFILIARAVGAEDIRVPLIGLADGLIDRMARRLPPAAQ